MIKQIKNNTIKIKLEEGKILAEPFIRFIENGIESGFIGGTYKPMGDKIGSWQLHEEKNFYSELQHIANTRDY